jgi:uncharacterized iron-regulated membrane protein
MGAGPLENRTVTDLQAAPARQSFKRPASLLSRMVGRKIWLTLHLYLGLFLGSVFAVIGVTGSLLVFWQEIDEWLNPDLMTVAASPKGVAAYRPLDEITAAARAAIPAEAKPSYAYYPRHEAMAFWFFYSVPNKMTGQPDTGNVFVDPYTSKVLGTRTFYSSESLFKYAFTGFLFALHYSVLMGDAGGVLVGILGVTFLVSVLSGVYLWWPARGKWRQALTFKRRARFERINFDVHKLSGIYPLVPLLVVLVTGIYFNLPAQCDWLMDKFSPVVRPAGINSSMRESVQPIGLDAAMSIAKERFPDSSPDLFSLPVNETGVYSIYQAAPIGSGLEARRTILLDQYDGATLYVNEPTTGSFGTAFLNWIWPMHSGHALGMTGRLLVCASGLACVALFATGVARWLHKRRARTRLR